MQLNDRELRQLLPRMDIKVPEYASPFDADQQVQPASIDLRVDRVVWRQQLLKTPVDLTNKLSTNLAARHSYKDDLGARGKFRLKPGEIVMARTLEEFTVPAGFSAEIFTRSSFGRLGLSVTCASYINPGYRGHMPLQIKNLSRETIFFPPLIAMCQLVVRRLTGEPDRAYGNVDLRSKYADDDGGPSRWWMDSIIKENQQALGATNVSPEAQEILLRIILTRDLSTQARFEKFLRSAKAVDLERVDSTLDAFARAEQSALRTERLLTGLGAIVLLLIAASIGALFSTPFNETKYGPLHLILWIVTVVTSLLYFPIARKKLTSREADFLLPEDLNDMRVRGSLEAPRPPQE